MNKEEFLEYLKSDKQWSSDDGNEFRAYGQSNEYTQRWEYILVNEIIYGWTQLEGGYDEGDCDSVHYHSYEDLIRNEFE